MPMLPKLRVERVVLPTTEDLPEDQQAWIDLELPARLDDYSKVDGSKGQMYQNAQVVALKVKDWNFTDENGEKTPITVDNVMALDFNDYGFLVFKLGLHKLYNALQGIEAKKKAS